MPSDIIYDPTGEGFFLGDFSRLPELDAMGGHIVDPCTLPVGSIIKTALHHSEVLPSMDFETYSEAGYYFEPQHPHGDVVQANGRTKWVPPYKVKGLGPQGKGGLPVVGTPVYAEHPSTEIVSLVYDLKDGRGRRRWAPGFPNPYDLLDHIAGGNLIEAWNVTFEWYIWNLVATRRHGWPVLTMEQCRCAMAKARRFSLAGRLQTTSEVLGLPGKDKAGDNLIRKLSVPQTPTKGRSAHRWTPATAWGDFCAFYDYNDQDVAAEDHASARIPDLTPYEFATWQLDQRINARGVLVDIATLDAALEILAQAQAKYNAELGQITGGAVESVSQNQRFIGWVRSRGVHTDSLDADHRTELLKRDLPPDVRRAIEIAELIMSANVKKLRTLKLQVSSDGRLRDQYTYCGADRTGRASAGGVQLQNITAKGPKSARCGGCGKIFGSGAERNGCPRCGQWLDIEQLPEWTIQAVEQAIEDISYRNLDYIERIWGAPIDVLCGCLRGLFMAAPGKKLVCCDFSAIEAVAQACLSRCHWRIEVFATHGKIYEMSAAKITGNTLDFYLEYKKQHGHHHEDRKKIGKIAELASGYQGWVGAWKAFGADEYFSDEEIKDLILKWREDSPEIVTMWGGQYVWCGPGKWDYRHEFHGLEGAALQAVLNPGQCFSYLDITYGVADDVLFCRLPSGRFLHYHRPRVHDVPDKLNRGPALQLTFEGYNSNAQKGRVGWGRWETWGGKLFENCIAGGTLVLTSNGWKPIEHVSLYDKVHDGIDWAAHGGIVYKNKQNCTEVDGVAMTPDHEVLTNDGWEKASKKPEPYRPDLRHVDGATPPRKRRKKIKMAIPLRVREYLRQNWNRRKERREGGEGAELRLQYQAATGPGDDYARHEQAPGLCGISVDARPLYAAIAPSMAELRRAWHYGLPGVAKVLRGFLARYGAYVPSGSATRSAGQHGGVFPGELPLGSREGKRQQQTNERGGRHAVGAYDDCGGVALLGRKYYDTLLPAWRWLARLAPVRHARPAESQHVYDIINAGPRRRFVVLGDNGPFIVHNCVQAVSADIQFEALQRLEAAGYPIVMHTHDEGTAEVPNDPRYNVEAMAAIMSERPAWAAWWPLKAAGWEHKRYQKD